MTKEDFKEVFKFLSNLSAMESIKSIDLIYAEYMTQNDVMLPKPKFKPEDRVILCFEEKVFEYTIVNYICHVEDEAFYYAKKSSLHKELIKIGENGLSLKKNYTKLWKQKYPEESLSYGSSYPSAWKPEAYFDGCDWVVQYPPYFFELNKKTKNG